MTYASFPRSVREREGIAEVLIRLCVSIEALSDKSEDVEAEFEASKLRFRR